MKRNTFLSRLLGNTAGNTFAIAAAALIPLMSMVGGAVDASRYYMTVTRLQNACDAGALAARRAMANNSFTNTEKQLGLNFFDQNYPATTFGLTGLTRDYTADSGGKVTGTASGTLPTTLMGIFGFKTFNVAVDCSAEINISNTDITFVLDVTGSMNCAPNNPNGGSCNNIEASNAKIKGLRSAVASFYDVVSAATSSSAQVRFGIVPYSSNINVGKSIPTQYMATNHTYQSREPQITTTTTWSFVSMNIKNVYNRRNQQNGKINWVKTYKKVYSKAACQALMLPPTNDSYVNNSIVQNSIVVHSTTQSGNIRTREMTADAQFTSGVPTYKYIKKRKKCRVGYIDTLYDATMDFTYVDKEKVTTTFNTWIYKPVNYDVSTAYTTGSVVTPTGYQGANVTNTWAGCIENAQTVNSANFNPVPSGAYDLDINLVPATNAQKWAPQLPNAVYKREVSGSNYLGNLTDSGDQRHPYYVCPKPAQKLKTMTRTALVNYLSASNGFIARGSTYHDLGMIWGGRFASPRGIFASENATAPNGDAIARHIVFMTDGVLSVYNELYNPYGVEWWDRRVEPTGSSNALFNRHAARFQAACRAAKNENISVWVVAFGTSLTQNLKDCATPGRAYQANSTAQLQAAFREIAQKIAALRLTK